MGAVAETTCLSLRGDATELAEAVAVAATVAPAKSPRQVLQNLLLEATNGVVRVTGSDLDLSVRVVVGQVTVEREGRLLVNASRLQQILREHGDREAGGRVGRLEGDDDLLAEGTLVAATGGLFPKLTELLQTAG